MSALLHRHTPLLLEDFVNDLFASSEYAQVRNIHCQTSGSEVVLRGTVSSFDYKQMAHTLAKTACGMRDITNEIVIVSDRRDS